MTRDGGTTVETVGVGEPRIGRDEPRGTGCPQRSKAQMDKVLCVVIWAPEDVWRLDVTLTLMKVI